MMCWMLILSKRGRRIYLTPSLFSTDFTNITAMKENFPHTITPPPPAWTVDTSQVCSPFMLLATNSDHAICSSDQATFCQSLLFHFCQVCVHCSVGILCWNETRYGLLLLSPICLKVWCVAYSKMLLHSPQLYIVAIWASVAFLSAWSRLLTSLGSICKTDAYCIFYLFHHSGNFLNMLCVNIPDQKL